MKLRFAGGWVIATAVVALAIHSPAQAAVPSTKTGNDLLNTCTNDRDDAKFWLCFGFLDGVTISVSFIREAGLIKGPFCIPSGVTNGQVRDIVVRYLQDNPAKRHLPGAVLTMSALKDAFPCAEAPTQ